MQVKRHLVRTDDYWNISGFFIDGDPSCLHKVLSTSYADSSPSADVCVSLRGFRRPNRREWATYNPLRNSAPHAGVHRRAPWVSAHK